MDHKIKLAIVSDGTCVGTKLVDTVTGREVAGIQIVSIEGSFMGEPWLLSCNAKFCVYGPDGQVGQKPLEQGVIKLIELKPE